MNVDWRVKFKSCHFMYANYTFCFILLFIYDYKLFIKRVFRNLINFDIASKSGLPFQ